MIELHYFPGNASFAPHVMLHEMEIPHKLIFVDRANNAHKSTSYLAMNPAGRIPTMIDDGQILSETAAICLHLADKNPQGKLAPELGTDARAHFYKWLMFLTNTIQPDVINYYYSDRYTTDPDGVDAVKDAAGRRLMAWFQIVENHLEDDSHFLGEHYSVLDIYILMLSRWGRYLATPPRDMSKLGRLCRRILARPAVKSAVKIEGIEGDFLV